MHIKELVEKYRRHRKSTYLKDDYNESQLRMDFIDPLFEILGWDINNKSGKPTNEREVLVEEGLKEDSQANTKKPDYTFRLFSERKFFVEAKKPTVKIDTNNESARQVRRYGFTAKLKISVLTNFEYLAIYDCSKAVDEHDGVSKSRVSLYHYTEYEEAFDTIKKQLGHDSVYSGEFDAVWIDIENQLQLSSVDSLFLRHINEWRIILGQEIYAHKPQLSVDGLNDAVQAYINSIIFLRVCEDRNLETYKTLLEFANKKEFSSLVKIFKQADKKYNAGLFSQPFIEEIVFSDTSKFWDIIKYLYYPESTYSFSVFSSDVLGNIYEIFLGEHLDIQNGHIQLTKKPENIDRDIVTTPTFIIKDILRQTVLEYCRNKTDEQIMEASFADISCGSGAFLLETYQLLQDLFIDYYLENDKSKLLQIGKSNYKLPYRLKREILEKCIFGIDKDYSAVQACKFGLLLKLLEDEDNSTVTSPALPCLDENIQFGNSLVSLNNTPNKYVECINPFDFSDTKYDVIIGNPPYMATKDIKEHTPYELPIYKSSFEVAKGQFDKYYLFIEQGFKLLKNGGYLGYIVPSKFTKVGSAKRLRTFLAKNKAVTKITSFGANQLFQDKTTYTCLLTLNKSKNESFKYFEVNSIKKWKTRDILSDSFEDFKIDSLSAESWILYPQRLKPIYDSICAQSKRLEEIVGSKNIYNGIQTSANDIYIHEAIRQDNDYIHFIKDDIEWRIEKELTRPYFKTSNGESNMYTYRPFAPNAFVIYPYIKKSNIISFVNIKTLKADYPYLYKYLNHYKDKLDERDLKPVPETSDEWYRYGRHQCLDKCDVPSKIIVGIMSQGNKYAIDYNSTLISSGGTAGYCMITLPEDSAYSIYYIQALLNSKYLEWFSSLIGEVFRGGYIARGTKVLKNLPIRTINFESKTERALHEKIAETQKKLIDIQKRIDDNSGNNRVITPLSRQFTSLKSILDSSLKDLYNLGELDKNIPLISEIYATN